MTKPIDYKVTGVKVFQQNIKTLELGFLNGIEKAVLSSVQQIERDAKLKVARYSGATQRSIVSGLTEKNRKRVVGMVGVNSPAGASLEFGRPPSRSSSGTPLWKRGPFRRWVAAKLGNVELAYVVARAIHRHGYEAKPFLMPALTENIKETKNRISAALKDAARTFRARE